jgi:hypothetical protein
MKIMSSVLQFDPCQLAVSPSLNRTEARAFADSYSHRGFSPVLKAPSRFWVTVLTVFRYALKGEFYGYRILQYIGGSRKPLKRFYESV